jgi:hypothetical protein
MNNNLPHPLELVPSNKDSGRKAATGIHETQNLEAYLFGMIDQDDIQFIRIYGLRKQFSLFSNLVLFFGSFHSLYWQTYE